MIVDVDGRPFGGTATGDAIELTATDSPPAAPDSYSLTLSPDGASLSGTYTFYYCILGVCGVANSSVTMSRCACYDGNELTGDGCGLECLVEPCWSCSGDPSMCVPVADSTPCEHPSDCIAGGTCSAGSCDGGTTDEGCLDMSGSWLRTRYAFNSPYVGSSVSHMIQQSGNVRIYEHGSTYLFDTAIVDPQTRALELDGTAAGFPNCSGYIYDTAHAATDGQSFDALGTGVAYGGVGRCMSSDEFAETGVRCADPAEASDGCRADSCMRCSGSPETCEPLPDGVACASADPCTVVATCNAGECVASISDRCPVCQTCDGAGGCKSAPRNNCRRPFEVRNTKLSLSNEEDDADDVAQWSWKKGARIATPDLGRPDVYGEVALCLFDESSASPALLYSAIFNAGLGGFGSPTGVDRGWSRSEDGSARLKEPHASSVRMDSGEAGKGLIKMKGRGGFLSTITPMPTSEIPLPVRVQFQIEGGACFEATYGADDVSRNTPGSFRAKGSR
jgi:hypothetical protein